MQARTLAQACSDTALIVGIARGALLHVLQHAAPASGALLAGGPGGLERALSACRHSLRSIPSGTRALSVPPSRAEPWPRTWRSCWPSMLTGRTSSPWQSLTSTEGLRQGSHVAGLRQGSSSSSSMRRSALGTLRRVLAVAEMPRCATQTLRRRRCRRCLPPAAAARCLPEASWSYAGLPLNEPILTALLDAAWLPLTVQPRPVRALGQRRPRPARHARGMLSTCGTWNETGSGAAIRSSMGAGSRHVCLGRGRPMGPPFLPPPVPAPAATAAVMVALVAVSTAATAAAPVALWQRSGCLAIPRSSHALEMCRQRSSSSSSSRPAATAGRQQQPRPKDQAGQQPRRQRQQRRQRAAATASWQATP